MCQLLEATTGIRGIANHVGVGNVIVHRKLLDLGGLEASVGGLHLDESRSGDGGREGASKRAGRYNAPGEHA